MRGVLKAASVIKQLNIYAASNKIYLGMLRTQNLWLSRSKFGIQGEIEAARFFFPVRKIRSVIRSLIPYLSLTAIPGFKLI